MIRLLRKPAKANAYLLDFGSTRDERVSVYITPDQFLVVGYTDTTRETHTARCFLAAC